MDRQAPVKTRSIHLLWDQLEPARPSEQPQVNGHGLPRLEVPDGVSRLVGASAQDMKLEASLDGAGVFFEPVDYEHQTYLMALCHGPQRLRVNGHRAPAVTFLAERDHIQIDAETALRMAIFHSPRIGPPSPEIIGKTCPVCLTPFTAEPPTTVFICTGCGLIAHCEGDEKPENERLECIKLSPTCPACNEPVMMTQGYTWQPELNRE